MTSGLDMHLDLPPLPDGWEYRALGELIEQDGLSYGVVQPGAEVNDGVPLLRVKNLRDGRIVGDVIKIHRAVEEKYLRTRLRGGEVLLSLVGSVGATAVVPKTLAGWNVARAVAVIRSSDAVPSDWLRLCLSSELAQFHMAMWQTSTVQATLNLRDVRRLPIVMPPNSERTAITKLIGALDDKIAVNERIAVTADELVRNQYLDICQRDDNLIRLGELGEQRREIVRVDELEDKENYIGLEHVPRRHVWLNRWADASGLGSSKGRFEEGDILFGKLRPYFHKVVIALVDGVASTDIIVIRPRKEMARGWLLAAASSDDVVGHASAIGDGTRMPRAKWQDIASFEVPWPGDAVAAEFNEFVAALTGRVRTSVFESQNLAELRDALLPGLMSGAIRVRDAEKAVEEAT